MTEEPQLQGEEAVRAAHDLAAMDPRAGQDLLAAGLLAAQLDPAASPEKTVPPEPAAAQPEEDKPAHKPARHAARTGSKEGE
jgi:hypothetical protein